jgi:hypothetical protein
MSNGMHARTRPSTPLGDRLGTAMRGAALVMDCALPIAAISLYRLIPGDARGALFGGPSASGAALRTIRAQRGGGWQVISQIAVSNHAPRPPLPGH